MGVFVNYTGVTSERKSAMEKLEKRYELLQEPGPNSSTRKIVIFSVVVLSVLLVVILVVAISLGVVLSRGNCR